MLDGPRRDRRTRTAPRRHGRARLARGPADGRRADRQRPHGRAARRDPALGELELSAAEADRLTAAGQAACERPRATRTRLAIPTRWMDNDVYGHVNNVQYYSYFDTVINQYLITEGGLDIHAGASSACAPSRTAPTQAALAFPETDPRRPACLQARPLQRPLRDRPVPRRGRRARRRGLVRARLRRPRAAAPGGDPGTAARGARADRDGLAVARVPLRQRRPAAQIRVRRRRPMMSAIVKAPVEGRVRVEGVNLAGDDQADRARARRARQGGLRLRERGHGAGGRPSSAASCRPGMFGENLTTEGVDVTSAVIGERWRVGTVELEVCQPRLPCVKLGLRFGDPLMVQPLRPGAAGRAPTCGSSREGELGAGDAIEIARPARRTASRSDGRRARSCSTSRCAPARRGAGAARFARRLAPRARGRDRLAPRRTRRGPRAGRRASARCASPRRRAAPPGPGRAQPLGRGQRQVVLARPRSPSAARRSRRSRRRG